MYSYQLNVSNLPSACVQLVYFIYCPYREQSDYKKYSVQVYMRWSSDVQFSAKKVDSLKLAYNELYNPQNSEAMSV
jgi:hypothetical protein